MEWEWLNIVGIVAFASSGAIVAMEERYDLLGVVFLAFATSFGGGVLRNVLLGQPVAVLFQQDLLFGVALLAAVVMFLLPRAWFAPWRRLETFFDACGLAAFSIQAAMFTTQKGFPFVAVVVAALLTGAGGGIIRDVLARRRPAVFQPETLYGVWAMVAAGAIALGWPQRGWPIALLVVFVVAMRMASVIYRWRLPVRDLAPASDEKP
jgi:uncharacterized membrane protein YeiH